MEKEKRSLEDNRKISYSVYSLYILIETITADTIERKMFIKKVINPGGIFGK